MSDFLFDPPAQPSIPVRGETREYPVRRIFCVGRNYAAHAQEMGYEVDREKPFYFSKSCHATTLSGAAVPYPPGTENYHYEMELAVALGGEAFRASREEAAAAIWGYCCALDMTRRDLQISERNKKRPWTLGKDVEHGAVFAPIAPAAEFGPVAAQRIHLSVNGELRQDSTLDLMVWKVDEIVSHLSGFYHLGPGDVIMTGTPEGVGPVVAGDVLSGGIDGLDPVSLTLTEAE